MKFPFVIWFLVFGTVESSLRGSIRGRRTTPSTVASASSNDVSFGYRAGVVTDSSNEWSIEHYIHDEVNVDEIIPRKMVKMYHDDNEDSKAEHEKLLEDLFRRQQQQHGIVDTTANHRILLLPRLMQLDLWTYMETVNAQFAPIYSKLIVLMVAANKEAELRNATGTTMFAPDNAAITPEIESFLLHPNNVDVLVQTMDYHIVPDIVSYLHVDFDGKLKNTVTSFLSASGDIVDIAVSTIGVLINNETRAMAFSLAQQSIIYRIDRLLVPPSLKGVVPASPLLNFALQIVLDSGFEFPIVVPTDDGWVENAFEAVISSDFPSMMPMSFPSFAPTTVPSTLPSDSPSYTPSATPSTWPSDAPSTIPSDAPSSIPSDTPSTAPSAAPSTIPSDAPSGEPSAGPSTIPSDVPSSSPSSTPSALPSDGPSTIPSFAPSSVPTSSPSSSPSYSPSTVPTGIPSIAPSDVPSLAPTSTTQENRVSIEKALDSVFTVSSAVSLGNDDAVGLFRLFSDALTFFGAWERNSGFVTLFIPRGLKDVDNDYGLNLKESSYNLHLISLIRFHIANGVLTRTALGHSDSSIEMLTGGNAKPLVLGDKAYAIESNAHQPALLVSSSEADGIGIVHVVNQVLIPQWVTLNTMSLMETYDEMASNPTYSTFLSLIVAGDLEDKFRDLHDVTVFGPQNNAFSTGLFEYLTRPKNLYLLINVVTYHVISDAVINHLEVAAAPDSTIIHTTFQGSFMKLSVHEQEMYVNDEIKVHAYSLASRSILFRISSLLVPKSVQHLMPAKSGSHLMIDTMSAIAEPPAVPILDDLEQEIVFPADVGGLSWHSSFNIESQ